MADISFTESPAVFSVGIVGRSRIAGTISDDWDERYYAILEGYPADALGERAGALAARPPL